MGVHRFLVVSLALMSHLAFAQVTGEWTFSDFPESMISNIAIIDDYMYLTINSEHDYEDTLKYEYTIRVLRVDINSNNYTDFDELFVENNGLRRYANVRLDKFRDSWILSRGYFNPYGIDTFHVSVLNENFEYQSTTSKTSNDTPLNILTTIAVDSIGYFGIGSFVALGDSLLSVHIGDEAHEPDIKRFRYSPILPFITSIDYDAIRRKFLIFNYLGIAELNDTLGLLKVHYSNTIHTATHGRLIAREQSYYAIGCTPFNVSVENRDIVFHKYDTSFQIQFRDTFGRDGKDDYPFIFNALDERNGSYVVGGHFAGPSNFTFKHPLKFFIAKYDDSMKQIWYHEYGGETNYVINGLKLLEDNRCVAYGLRVDTTDGIRYPYILIVDENGEITSTTETPLGSAEFFQILYPPGSEDLVLEVNETIGQLQLMTIDGRMILSSEKLTTGRHSFETSGLPPGVYPIVAHGSGGEIQSGKWVKRR